MRGVKTREHEHADHRAEERAPVVAMPMARPAQPLLGQGIAVDGGGGVGRRTRDVEQDGAAASAVDRADVHADQDDDRHCPPPS